MQTTKEQREEWRRLHADAMAYEENACGAAMNKRAFNQAAQKAMPAILSDLEAAERWREALELISASSISGGQAQLFAKAALEGKSDG